MVGTSSKPYGEATPDAHGRARGVWQSLLLAVCDLCAGCGPLAAAMLALGLMLAVVSCPAWAVGVWLPHPVLGAVVAAEGMHRLRRIHGAIPPLMPAAW